MPTLNTLRLDLTSLNDTDQLGRSLAAAIPAGMTVALCGTLGAGKTRLVEAMAAALGVERDEVVSPTFVLCQQYSGNAATSATPSEPRTLYHFDTYRLADEDEFLELGIEEYFESDGITLIEWADRVSRCLPRDHLRIEIAVTGDETRSVSISATGRESGLVVERLRENRAGRRR